MRRQHQGEERDQYTAIGPTVNLAQRIESLAGAKIAEKRKRRSGCASKKATPLGVARSLSVPRFSPCITGSVSVVETRAEDPREAASESVLWWISKASLVFTPSTALAPKSCFRQETDAETVQLGREVLGSVGNDGVQTMPGDALWKLSASHYLDLYLWQIAPTYSCASIVHSWVVPKWLRSCFHFIYSRQFLLKIHDLLHLREEPAVMLCRAGVFRAPALRRQTRILLAAVDFPRRTPSAFAGSTRPVSLSRSQTPLAILVADGPDSFEPGSSRFVFIVFVQQFQRCHQQRGVPKPSSAFTRRICAVLLALAR